MENGLFLTLEINNTHTHTLREAVLLKTRRTDKRVAHVLSKLKCICRPQKPEMNERAWASAQRGSLEKWLLTITIRCYMTVAINMLKQK